MFNLMLLLISAIFYLIAMYKCEEHETRSTVCIVISFMVGYYNILYLLAYGWRI